MKGQENLIEILTPDFIFEDERGELIQLVHDGQKQINIVTTKSGETRGGHYHIENVETFYVVSGRFTFTAEREGMKEEYLFTKGDMFSVKPYTVHSFKYLENSVVVVMYDKGVEHEDGTIDSIKVE